MPSRLNGGRVYELSAVTQIQHTTPAVVRTAKGQVTAKYVIVAGNAYLGDKVEPELAKRSMPCGTQVITTERLSEDLARSLIPKTTVWKTVTICLITTVLPPTTACCTAAAWSMARATRMTLSALWCQKLLKTFPQLKGVKIDYRWTGNFLLTPVAYAAVWSPRYQHLLHAGLQQYGVSCTHLAGRLIAELLRGDAERFDAFANLPHYPFPGGARCAYRLPRWARRITACAIVWAFNFRLTVKSQKV